MKRYIIAVLAVLLLLSGCSAGGGSATPSASETQKCYHEWTEATCIALSQCKKCGKTRGRLSHHEYTGGTCAEAPICTVCGAEGRLKTHDFQGGDCQTPAICTVCGAEGKLKDHDFQGGTCITPGICTVCGAEGELEDHEFSEVTCTEPGICSVCGAETPALGHHMRQAICDEPATCFRCGYTEGEPLGHVGEGICSKCGKDIPITGSGYGDSVVSDINLGDDIYVLHMTHTGRGNFIVHSFGADGNEEYLINEIGSYDGTVLFVGESPLMLNIRAGGNWTYEIKKLEATSTTSFSGECDYVTGIFSCSSGPQAWHFKHNGSGNFIVHMYTTAGCDYIINEIGAYDASQVITVPSGSKVFFEIFADGAWEIYPDK